MSLIDKIITQYGIQKLDLLSRYPRIPSYHKKTAKGLLTEVVSVELLETEKYYVTELISGSHVRVIISGNDYIIGDRISLLYAKGDRLGYSNRLITNPVMESLRGLHLNSESIFVLNFIVYGAPGLEGSERYSEDGSIGFRLHDVEEMRLSNFEFPLDELMALSWDDRDGFLGVTDLKKFAKDNKFVLVPALRTLGGKAFPIDRISGLKFLQKFPMTKVGLNTKGSPKGIVVRSEERDSAFKMIVDDYIITGKKEKWSNKIMYG